MLVMPGPVSKEGCGYVTDICKEQFKLVGVVVSVIPRPLRSRAANGS